MKQLNSGSSDDASNLAFAALAAAPRSPSAPPVAPTCAPLPEAQAQYALMHALEDEASDLASKVGCVACVLGDAGRVGGAGAEDGLGPRVCAADPELLSRYGQTYRAGSWQDAVATAAATAAAAGVAAAAASRAAGSAEATGRDTFAGGSAAAGACAASLRDRARGAVVGGAVADAAAMGVHWLYDLDVLASLDGEAAAHVSFPTFLTLPTVLTLPRSAGGGAPRERATREGILRHPAVAVDSDFYPHVNTAVATRTHPCPPTRL
eukprot:357678-Chlamydomonas_euryale.AAC.4